MKKRRLKGRAKLLIALLLVALAMLMLAGALAANHIKSPATAANGYRSATLADEKISVFAPKRRDGTFSLLIVGEDAASKSTDTIMLAAFDTELKTMNIMSIPRDTIVQTDRATKKINAAYAVSHGDISALASEVESITGILPDKYVLVSVDAFVQLVDAIGGVEVDVPLDMHYDDPAQDLTIHISKGLQTLDGYDAMGFMRYRKTYAEGDIGRIKVQHTFIEALIKKMLTPQTFARVPELARIIKENVETDLSLGNIIWLGKQMLSMNMESGVKVFTLPGGAQYYQNLSYYFPDQEEVLSLVNQYFNPYEEPIEELNLFKE